MAYIKNLFTRNKIDIVHIYFGTAGAAGLYLHEIYLALKGQFDQECVVNYYFPFDYGRKYFFKLTELTGRNLFKKIRYLRYLIRYIELSYGMIKSFFLVVRIRPALVNYSLISNNYLEYIFIKLIKKFSGCRIILTLHDVVPYESQYVSLFSRRSIRQKIILESDYILVHNINSLVDLRCNFTHNPDSLLVHSFPLMSAFYLTGITSHKSNKLQKMDFIFLFVGHGRVEKGVDLLVEAWRNIEKNSINAKLIVAGNFGENNVLLEDIKLLKNVTLINEFLSDENYFKLIAASDYVVLPYRCGTNSGIPSTAMSLGANVICSDIPMFKSSALLSEENFFRAGSSESLANKIIEKCDGIDLKSPKLDLLLNGYRDDFRCEISSLYKSLLVDLNK